MGKPTGFKEFVREMPSRRAVPLRVLDYKEVYNDFPEDKLRTQGARCMNCGIPYCHSGCPLGNVIPEFNDLVYKGRWRDALAMLLKTNNFPEFTGRVCPAPCEEACTLNIWRTPVTIKLIEEQIIDRGFAEGLDQAQSAAHPHRQARGRRRLRPGGPGGRGAAQTRLGIM